MAGYVSVINAGKTSQGTLLPKRIVMVILFLWIISLGYKRISIFICIITFRTHIHHQFGMSSVWGQILRDKLVVFQDPIRSEVHTCKEQKEKWRKRKHITRKCEKCNYGIENIYVMKAVYNYWPETCEQHNFCCLCVKNNKEVANMHEDMHLQKNYSFIKTGSKTEHQQ